MARPTKRSGSDKHQFRKRIPADVLGVARGKRIMFSLPKTHTGDESIRVSAKIGVEVLISLRTEDDALATLRQGRALEQFERAIAAFREGPRALTHKQHIELAGIIYRDLGSGFEDEPVSAGWWQIVAEVAQRVLTPPPCPSLMIETFPGEAQLVELEKYVGPFLDAILFREGVIPTKEDRPKLLRAFAKALIDAANKLTRNAEGDYTPDDVVVRRYPKWEGIAAKALATPSGLSFDDLLTRWESQGDKAPGSVVAFRTAVASLSKHLGHNDPMRVTKADIRAWRGVLLADGERKAKTVNDSYLTHIGTLYRLGRREDLLDINPTEGVRAQEKRVAGKGAKVYTDDEVAALLALADKEVAPHLYWMPWLLALTGARVSEIAQLWGEHVKPIDGIDAISITTTQDGGRLKNHNSERDVPLHPALIERGFLDFVKARGSGPLFYGGKDATPRPRKDGQVRHASKGTANRLREWIRESGFTDPRKAPCHAFRHWFKSKFMDLGLSDKVADAIQGHAKQSVADQYRHPALATKLKNLRDIPVPRLTAAATMQSGDERAGGPGQFSGSVSGASDVSATEPSDTSERRKQ